MRRYLAVCLLLLGSLITAACQGGSTPSTALATTVTSNVTQVHVEQPLQGFIPKPGITVTQSTDYNDTTQQPVNVITTQVTDSNGNATFTQVPNQQNCFSIAITPTYGITRAVDCTFPADNYVTLNYI
jgi:hypothetical protein